MKIRRLSVLIALASLGVPNARAGLLAGSELVELLPGDAWLLTRPGLEIGSAVPWGPLGVRLWWSRLRAELAGPTGAEIGIQQLRAGPVLERRWWSGASLAMARGCVGFRLALDELRLDPIVAHTHVRADVHAALRFGPGRLGLRWEGPLAPAPDVPAAGASLVVTVQGSHLAAAVQRRSSRYGLQSVWQIGIAARAAPAAVGLSLRERSGGLSAELNGTSLGCSLAATLTGPRAGGLALVLRWRP